MQLFATLEHQRQNLESVPPRPHHAELNLPITLPEPVIPAVAEEQEPDAESAEPGSEKDVDDQTTPLPQPSIEFSPEDINLEPETNPEDDQTAPDPQPPAEPSSGVMDIDSEPILKPALAPQPPVKPSPKQTVP